MEPIQPARVFLRISAAIIFTIPERISGYESYSKLRLFQAWLARQPWHIISAVESTSAPDLLSVIPSASRVKVPVLLISGERDWIVPTDKARQILSAIRGKRKELVVIPNAVHDTTYSAAPTLYASTVLSFLDRSFREIKGQHTCCSNSGG
jgi:pimeloyl-ACP methyl ester carboxylesterase